MKRLMLTVIIVAAMLFVSACGGGGGKTERPGQMQKMYFPDWWQIQDSNAKQPELMHCNLQLNMWKLMFREW